MVTKRVRLKSEIYYNGKLIYTVIHPLSVSDPREAKEDVREKIIIATKPE